jgi:peroxiredoxin
MAQPLTPGSMVPNFVLNTSDGGSVQISDFRGRRNLALIFVGRGTAEADRLITGLAQQRNELDEEETAVLVIATGAIQPARAFPVLNDTDGGVHRRFAAEHAPAVYLTDRYGEIYSTCRVADGDPLPSADEILASLRHINVACPE